MIEFFTIYSTFLGLLYILTLTFYPRIGLLVFPLKLLILGYTTTINPLFAILYLGGYIFLPYSTIATLAFIFYWPTNPILCYLSVGLAIYGDILKRNKD